MPAGSGNDCLIVVARIYLLAADSKQVQELETVTVFKTPLPTSITELLNFTGITKE